MMEEGNAEVIETEPFKTYVANFRFVFYGVNRYYVLVNCICKTNYRTKHITDVQGLPLAINEVVVNARRHMYNISASGILDSNSNGENNMRNLDLYLAIHDTGNQFNNATEVWNLIMAYYYLIEARQQLMACNFGIFQQYVTGPYVQYIGQA